MLKGTHSPAQGDRLAMPLGGLASEDGSDGTDGTGDADVLTLGRQPPTETPTWCPEGAGAPRGMGLLGLALEARAGSAGGGLCVAPESDSEGTEPTGTNGTGIGFISESDGEGTTKLQDTRAVRIVIAVFCNA